MSMGTAVSALFVYLAVVGLIASLLALGSRPLRDLPMSDPLAALVGGVIIGPQVLGLVAVPGPGDEAVLEVAALLLLSVSLMDIALRYPVAAVRLRARPTSLLLLIVLPIMAAVSAGLSLWILGLAPAAAWLLGAALAPTDPVLASNVVIGEPAERDLPARLRQIISLESGANDAVALPLVTLGSALLLGTPLTAWGLVTLWETVAAVPLGVAVGWAAGRLVRREHEHDQMEAAAFLFFTVMLALFVLGIAELARTNGLLAVFTAGLAYNSVVSSSEREPEETIEEGVNRFAILPVFAMLGVALPWEAWVELGWPALLFVLAVLVLRRLPAVLALRRPLGLARPGAIFVGWFGPVGIAAVYYLARAARDGGLPPAAWAAGTLVVAASTVVHGMSATAGRRLYARGEGAVVDPPGRR
jgi:sodium/hydrogen antiporter